MVKQMMKAAVLSAAGLLLSAPAVAQEPAAPMVSANDAPGVLKALGAAGYDVELFDRSEEGKSTYIQIESYDLVTTVRFADCDEAVPKFCETLVISTWWGRNTPISDAAIAKANRENKYVSVYRDDDGDPVMQWAILTRREGVPATVFLNALQRFIAIAGNYTDEAYVGDEPDSAEDATQATT